jgi:hypothetical protein
MFSLILTAAAHVVYGTGKSLEVTSKGLRKAADVTEKGSQGCYTASKNLKDKVEAKKETKTTLVTAPEPTLDPKDIFTKTLGEITEKQALAAVHAVETVATLETCVEIITDVVNEAIAEAKAEAPVVEEVVPEVATEQEIAYATEWAQTQTTFELAGLSTNTVTFLCMYIQLVKAYDQNDMELHAWITERMTILANHSEETSRISTNIATSQLVN